MNLPRIFDYDDYKKYFNDWVAAQPQKGHGEYRRLAQHLNVSSTLISQVFRGDKNLSLELAVEFADYLSLNEGEADYFLLMVEIAKAGSFKLKETLRRQIKKVQGEFNRLERRVQKDVELTEGEMAVFYSSWIYSATRLLTDIPEIKSASEIAARIHVPRNQVQKVLEFLLEKGLCKMVSGVPRLGPTRTHIGSSSPLVAKHHQNWRLLATQKMVAHDDNQFFFTAPMTLSQELAEQIRLELPTFIESITQRVRPAPSETARCLNVDWFEF